MLTFLVILALIKLGIDQRNEDRIKRQIEDHELHYFEEENPLD